MCPACNWIQFRFLQKWLDVLKGGWGNEKGGEQRLWVVREVKSHKNWKEEGWSMWKPSGFANWHLLFNEVKLLSSIKAGDKGSLFRFWLEHTVNFGGSCEFSLVLSDYKQCVCAKLLQSCLTPCDSMAVALQVALSMGFSRWEYWSGLTFPSPEDLPNPGIKSALAGGFFTTKPPGKPPCTSLAEVYQEKKKRLR